MRSIILQYSSAESKQLADLSTPINKAYSTKFKFEQFVDYKSRCPERIIYWEKVAYLNAILPKIEDGSLIVWCDVDSLCIGNEDLRNALPDNSIFGAVQLRGGLGGRQLVPWFNTGFMVMKNCPEIRTFFTNVWNRNTPTDEDAINAELKHNSYTINNTPITGLDIKWNCWNNNMAFCTNPVVRSFHGMNAENKLTEMTTFINQLPK